MSDTALLLLDYQETICRGALGQGSGIAQEVEERQVLENAQRCLEAARAAELTIVHVRVAFAADYSNRLNRSSRFARYEERGLLRADSPDAEFCAEVTPGPGEVVITKGCVDPFIGTGLCEALTGRGARRLILGGVATHMVVESCARHAADSGFDVVVLADLCAAHSAALHDFAMSNTLPAFATIETSAAWIEALNAQ